MTASVHQDPNTQKIIFLRRKRNEKEKKKRGQNITCEVLRHVLFITSHLLHVIVMPTFFQALDTKITQLNQKKISGLARHLIFHRFLPFNCCLSVVLQHNKGDYPENSIVVFCPNKKRSLNSLCVLIMVINTRGMTMTMKYEKGKPKLSSPLGTSSGIGRKNLHS